MKWLRTRKRTRLVHHIYVPTYVCVYARVYLSLHAQYTNSDLCKMAVVTTGSSYAARTPVR